MRKPRVQDSSQMLRVLHSQLVHELLGLYLHSMHFLLLNESMFFLLFADQICLHCLELAAILPLWYYSRSNQAIVP